MDAGAARAPIPAYTNVAIFDLPGCDCRRSLSVSGLAPGRLFSASAVPDIWAPLELHGRPVHRYAMEERGRIVRNGF